MFDISQYEHSATANKLGISNIVPEDKISHIKELDCLIDKAVEAWKQWCSKNKLGSSSVILTSGYRCPDLNNAVGGTQDSAHVEGYAADLYPKNNNTREFIRCLVDWASSGDVEFDEVIVEGLAGSYWVHIAVRSADGFQRMKTMKEVNGNLVPTTLEPKERTYGDNMSIYSNNTSDYSLDWTDERVYNLTPSEIDHINNDADEEESGGFFLQSFANGDLTNSEKRCLYSMKFIMDKLRVNEKQAAGIVGNLLYMTDGSLWTFKKSGNTHGICLWNSEDKAKFDKMHHRSCTLDEATIKEQLEYLCYTISDSLVTKLQKCYDENVACNMFFSQYVKKTTWPEMFKGLNSNEADKLREETSSRRGFSSVALAIWNAASSKDFNSIENYSGNGQDGPRIKKSDDSKTYQSDGDLYYVPESEQVFTREYEDTGDEMTEEDIRLARYYDLLFSTMMVDNSM